MSGVESIESGNTVQTVDAAASYTKAPVEVVFDVVREPDGIAKGSESESRLARGIAALQRAQNATGPGGKVAAPVVVKAAEPVVEGKRDAGGVESVEVDANGVPIVPPEAETPAEVTPEADPAPENVDPPAEAPEVAQIQTDLALARAQIDELSYGNVSDEDRTAWIADPVADIKALVMARTGLKEGSPELASALEHYHWALTVATLGGELPKDIKDRNEAEHAKRRDALAKTAQAAQGMAKEAREGREADRALIAKAFDASPDKYPYAAIGAEVRLGGMVAGDAAVLLWKQAIEAGTVKNHGDREKNAHEALRIYNEFSKTRLGKYVPAKNATPSPAKTPAASQGTAATTKTAPKTPPTITSKQAASAPAAKKVTEAPKGPEVIDASDKDARNRRLANIASKHFGTK